MRKQIVFITIFLTIAVSSLWPNFGYAFFTEPFTAFASSFIKIGSTLDQSVDAVTNVARSIYQAARQAKNQIERQHSMLRRNLREQISEIHRMLGAMQAILPDVQVDLLKQFAHVKQSVLAIISSLRSSDSHNSPSPSYLKRGTQQETPPEDSPQTLPLKVRGTEGVTDETNENEEIESPSLLKIIERIIVKEIPNSQYPISNKNQNEQISNSNIGHSLEIGNWKLGIENRLSNLITNAADLTSRLDEKDGSPYRNSALFNMISL